MTERTTVLTWPTTDHKRIGLLYLTAAFGFFLLGGLLALVIRSEPRGAGAPAGRRGGLQPAVHDARHDHDAAVRHPGRGRPGELLVPLQVGAADMVFPRLNALSFWLFLFGGLIVISGYLCRRPRRRRLDRLPAELELPYSTTLGTDLWIVGLALTGVASIFGAINFVSTTYTRRAPGMSMLRVPIFTWTVLVTSALILFSFPALTGALVMLLLDRRFGTAFFDPSEGGSVILWQHLFWFFGHPEVYIVALPFFGVISEIIPVFSRKPLFGYRFFVLASILIGAYSFTVWAHHMFTTAPCPCRSSASRRSSSPSRPASSSSTGSARCGGQLTFPTPMLWAVGFLYLFLTGGLTGVILGSPPLDFHLHDTYYVVAHFHGVLVGGSVFALFGAIYFWFPKMTGRRLSEPLGKLHFWTWLIGFTLAFFVQYQLGAEGMMRRYADYPGRRRLDDPQPGLDRRGLPARVRHAAVPPRRRLALRRPADQPADPWGANSLEWATTSPPPHHNFPAIPPIRSSARSSTRGSRRPRCRTREPAAVRRPTAGDPLLPGDRRLGGRSGWSTGLSATRWRGPSCWPAWRWRRALVGVADAFATASAATGGGRSTEIRRPAVPGRGGTPPAPTLAPFAVGLGVALAALGPVFGLAPVAVGAVSFLWGAGTWLRAGREEFDAQNATAEGGQLVPVVQAPRLRPDRGLRERITGMTWSGSKA